MRPFQRQCTYTIPSYHMVHIIIATLFQICIQIVAFLVRIILHSILRIILIIKHITSHKHPPIHNRLFHRQYEMYPHILCLYIHFIRFLTIHHPLTISIHLGQIRRSLSTSPSAHRTTYLIYLQKSMVFTLFVPHSIHMVTSIIGRIGIKMPILISTLKYQCRLICVPQAIRLYKGRFFHHYFIIQSVILTDYQLYFLWITHIQITTIQINIQLLVSTIKFLVCIPSYLRLYAYQRLYY